MTRKGRAITLSLDETEKLALQVIATELGYTWGDKPNISKLIEAIAQHELLIAHNNDWLTELLTAFHQAVICLNERGDSKNAQIVAELLLKRSELKNPLRKEIERFLETIQKPSWRQLLETYKNECQPFELSYQDAAQKISIFNVQYAEINFIDRHEYLQCWCQEIAGNADIAALRHNWSLRLDRITDAALSPVQLEWLNKFDTVKVEFYLYSGLAFAYESRPNDIYCDWVPGKQIKRVLREVFSTFWFYREIFRYGEDCQIVSPPDVRERFIAKLNKLNDLYRNPT